MVARRVEVSHETVREWCDEFGAAYAKPVRRRRPRPGDKWHLDELFVSVNGVRRYRWRAVDQRSMTLGVLVTQVLRSGRTPAQPAGSATPTTRSTSISGRGNIS